MPNSNLNPGSPEAIEAGCTCPVWDNCRGKGWLGYPGLWVMTMDCPLHGRDARREAAGA